VFARFATVAGERGSTDTARDIRGFAVKFYTDDGNWDLVGPMHGHLLGAAGALECVLSLLAMRHGIALPTMHLQQPDPECDLDYVANAAREEVAAQVMMSNSFAFGGTNPVLVLRRAG